MSKRRLLKSLEVVLSKKKVVEWILFIAWCGFILWITIFNRNTHENRIFRFEFFWAIRGWINGLEYGRRETIFYFENILLFIPFGLLFPRQKTWKHVGITAFAFSVLIEIIQLIFALGECELDDVIANTIGALIGNFAFIFLMKIYEKFRGESRV